MKKLTLLVLVSLLTINLLGQKSSLTKPLLFSNTPESIIIADSDLDYFFNKPSGETIQIDWEGKFKSAGKVQHYETKNSALQIIGIRLSQFENVMFSLSKRIDKDNAVHFTGRIISPYFSDGYVLEKNDEKSHRLIKLQTENIMPTCDHH